MSSELTPADLRSILDFSVVLARRAGVTIRQGSDAMHSVSDIGEKLNAVDLVTEYDVKVEELVKSECARVYPTFKFMGEESSFQASLSLTDDPTFCVDPIDGTTNFVHGFPWVCISIGLIYKRRPVLGVIYNPFLDFLYSGVHGQGSYLTRGEGAPCRLPLSQPRPLPSLSKALVCIEWGSIRSVPIVTGRTDSFLRLVGDPSAGVQRGRMVHGLRATGSGALNIAMVAQGGFDAYWEIGCRAWDVCAGIVIAQEAGCVVTGSHAVSLTENPFDVTEEVLMGNKYLIVRGVCATPQETALEAQKRIVREFYDTVDDIEL